MLFNLIVRADETLPMLTSRMFERTPDELADRYRTSTAFDFNALARLPTVMAREFESDDMSAMARLGYMDTPSINPVISSPVLQFPSHALLDLGLLDENYWENKRTHWRLCEGDPFRLFSKFLDRRPLPVEPEASSAYDPNLIAVMMPFTDDPSIDPVYLALVEGSKRAGKKCKRVDEMLTPADITEDIFNLIASSSLVIADITDLNPNVMFEVGYATGRGKQAVLICQDDVRRLPFDISHRRVFTYKRDKDGLAILSDRILKILTNDQ